MGMQGCDMILLAGAITVRHRPHAHAVTTTNASLAGGTQGGTVCKKEVPRE